MIYISAVGMVNALGNSPDEIAANLAAGVARACTPGPAGCREYPKRYWAAWKASCRSSRTPSLHTAPATTSCCCRAGADSARRRRGHRPRWPRPRGRGDGNSTSGLDEGDEHVRRMTDGETSTRWQYPQQELGDPSRFLANWLQLEGPAYTISTACSSSARAMIGGKRLIEAGLVDIAIVGGADTLSRMPVNGFNSLESFSPTLCEPFGRDRRGITIGEAAALMVLSREPADVALLGTGESSDAYHISAPHPQGEGAIRAITQASAKRACSRTTSAISTCTARPRRSTIRLNHRWFTISSGKACRAVQPNILPATRWALPALPKRL